MKHTHLQNNSDPNWKSLHEKIMHSVRGAYYFFEGRRSKIISFLYFAVACASLMAFVFLLAFQLSSFETLKLNFGYFAYTNENIVTAITYALFALRNELLLLGFITLLTLIFALVYIVLHTHYKRKTEKYLHPFKTV